MWVDESAQNKDKANPAGWVEQIGQATNQLGSFAYDEGTLTRIADRWQLIADRCRDAIGEAMPLTKVVGPGLDLASGAMADKANASGQAYLNMMKSMRAYCQTQADHCRKALGTYTEHEDETAATARSLNPGNEGGTI
ncbi:PE domain-containing protein [Saccharomonospora sp. NPDC046836]|uniref:PE domain-containing protein n=1 Tax=Saccharomonospora sp. NPDC046836 TaxID=3156921 RepID=UPI0033FBC360